jgi:hypothetical protein
VPEVKAEAPQQIPPLGETQKPTAEATMAVAEPKPVEEVPLTKKEVEEVMEVSGVKVTINIPFHLIEEAQSSTPEYRMKVAGALAAQVLKKYPEVTSLPSVDPVTIWNDIRKFIMTRLR